MRAKRLFVTVALFGALGVGAAPTSAEWFGDLYLGGAFTENSDLTAKDHSTEALSRSPLGTCDSTAP
jgi:hypothetical protein